MNSGPSALDWGREPQKAPPHNIEAEQALLAALLVDNRQFDKVVEILHPDMFYDAVNGRIYEAVASLVNAGRQANPVTLKNLFDQDGSLQEIGGAAYLVRIAASVVALTNSRDYAITIRDLWLRRESLLLAQRLSDTSRTFALGDDQYVTLEQTADEIHRLSESRAGHGTVTLAEAGQRMIEALDRETRLREAGTLIGITTGLIDLDRLLGGLRQPNLTIVAGRPGMGKTDLACTIILAAARQELRRAEEERRPPRWLVFFSGEMNDVQIHERLTAALTGIPVEKMQQRLCTHDELLRIIDANEELRRLPICINFTAKTPAAFGRELRGMRRKSRGAGLLLAVVDHIQHMQADGKVESRRVTVGAITNALKTLALQMEIPVIACSQLSRSVEQRQDKRPIMPDLRESGDIEQDADVILFLYREHFYASRDEPMKQPGQSDADYTTAYNDWEERCAQIETDAEIIIAKNRHGPAPRKVEVRFFGASSRFADKALPQHEAEA